MNFPRVALAAVASWVLYLGIRFLVHAVLLKDMYLQYVSVMRPEAEAERHSADRVRLRARRVLRLRLRLRQRVRGRQRRAGRASVRRARRHPAVRLRSVWDYMIWPVSAGLLAAWLIDFVVEFAIYGMVVGLIYKPVGRPRPAASTGVAAGARDAERPN